ncbi:hypothetical protein WJX72_007461 [[Myrmecia] bisecta]|uniref:Rubisco LSMT substrate-binding domain-containing protein n=1 Tax=[Myrmecia] bisecta TaxID=41462 RepID=A0AAW1P9X1_9CHLO
MHAARSRRGNKLCCTAQAQAVVTADSAASQLMGWVTEQGANESKLSCRPAMYGSSLALMTTRSVARGETLFSIPERAWITVQTVQQSEIGSFVADLEPWVQIALFLLHERRQPRSEWRAYLDSLPAEPDTPLSWTNGELEWLEGTQLLGSVYDYRQFFEGRYAELEAEVFASAREVFDEQSFAYLEFLWAVSVVRGKVHAPLDGESVALVPFADLVQHERGSTPGWKVQSGFLGRSGKAVTLEADQEYAAGEWVVMDFGPDKLDSQLLLDYGVLDPASTQGGFLLSLALAEGDRFFDDKADVLDLNGLAEAEQFTLLPNVEPPKEMLAFLRLNNLSGADAFLLESLFRNETWGHMLAPVSMENEQAVFQSMIKGCREALQGYATTIDEDLALLRTVQKGGREEMAVRARLGEKEALDSTLRFFEERFAQLDNLEYYQERRLRSLGLLDDDGNSTYDDFFKDGIA